MKYILLLSILVLPLAGCNTTGSSTLSSSTSGTTTSSNIVNIGYEIANFLQEFNTGVSAALPPVTTFLQQTHNSGDASTIQLYASLAAAVSGATSAAIKANLPPQQVQAVVSSVLAPSTVVTLATTPSN